MHACAVGENNQQQDTNRPKTQGDFRAARSKSRVLVMIPAHSTTKGEQTTQVTPLAWTQDLPPPSSHMRDRLPHPLEPAREHVTCFCSLMSPNKAFIPLNLCLAFYQLLLIESRSLGRYHRRAFAEGQDAAQIWCLQWASSRNRG